MSAGTGSSIAFDVVGDSGAASQGKLAAEVKVTDLIAQPDRHLRPRGALEPVIDLVLKKVGGLVEQIHRHQSIGEPADHLVAAAADRC